MLNKGMTYVCWRCGLELECAKSGCTSTSVMCCGEPMKLMAQRRKPSMEPVGNSAGRSKK